MHFRTVHAEEEKETIQQGLNNISEIFTPKPLIFMYNYPLILLPACSYRDNQATLSGSRDDLGQEAREIQHACAEDKILLSCACENQPQGS